MRAQLFLVLALASTAFAVDNMALRPAGVIPTLPPGVNRTVVAPIQVEAYVALNDLPCTNEEAKTVAPLTAACDVALVPETGDVCPEECKAQLDSVPLNCSLSIGNVIYQTGVTYPVSIAIAGTSIIIGYDYLARACGEYVASKGGVLPSVEQLDTIRLNATRPDFAAQLKPPLQFNDTIAAVDGVSVKPPAEPYGNVFGLNYDYEKCLYDTGARVVDPASPLYFAARQTWNARVQNFPFAVTYPTSVDQVQGIVKCAYEYQMKISVRAGGHGFEGYSTMTGATVIDLENFNQVEPDMAEKTVLVGGGVRQGEVYTQLYGKSGGKLGFSMGQCPAVSLGGYLQGGGLGFQTRTYSIGADKIIEAQIVDYKGDLITASADENPDLLWALAGSGGGNWGVVVSYKLKAMELPPQVAYFLILLPLEKEVVKAALKFYQENFYTADARMGSSFDFLPAGAGGQKVTIRGIWNGTYDEMMAELDKIGLMEQPWAEGKMLIAEAAPWLETYVKFVSAPTFGLTTPAELNNQTIIWENTRQYAKWSSNIVFEPLADEAIDILVDFGLSSPFRNVNFFAGGGALLDVPLDHNAFGFRNFYLNILYGNSLPPAIGAPLIERAAAQIFGVQQRLSKYVPQAAYVNIADANVVNSTMIFNPYADRLIPIKAKYNPINQFSNPQSLPVTGNFQQTASMMSTMSNGGSGSGSGGSTTSGATSMTVGFAAIVAVLLSLLA